MQTKFKRLPFNKLEMATGCRAAAMHPPGPAPRRRSPSSSSSLGTPRAPLLCVLGSSSCLPGEGGASKKPPAPQDPMLRTGQKVQTLVHLHALTAQSMAGSCHGQSHACGQADSMLLFKPAPGDLRPYMCHRVRCH